MPRINDYSVPETQGQGPVGGISPNLEAAGAVGRGLQNIGGALEQTSDVFHRREAQEEVSNTYATFAQARADWTQKLSQHIGDPDFDTEKFQQQYGDYVNQMADNVNTAEGKDYFNRQASRLGGSLLTKANAIQAQAAGAQAQAQLQTGINADTATLTKDPTQFDSVYESGQEMVDATIKANPKLQVHAPMLKEYLANKQAIAALKGMQQLKPGSLEDDEIGAGKEALDKGTFDKFLKPQDRDQLETYFRNASRAADAEYHRNSAVNKTALKDGIEGFGQMAIQKLESNTLSAKEVLNAKLPDGTDLPWESKQHWIQQINEHAKQEFRGNPAYQADVIKRIQLDDDDPRKISTLDQLQKEVGPGKLSISGYNSISGFLNKTSPEQQALNTNRKGLMKAAQTLIKPSMTGTGKDVTSLEKYNMFTADLSQAEAQQKAAGKPLADLYDPKSPDYFGKNLATGKYQTSLQDQLAASQKAFQQSVLQNAKPKDAPGVQPSTGDRLQKMQDFLKKQKAGS